MELIKNMPLGWGPTLIYDKSAIEALSKEQSYWLHMHFRVTIVPPFLLEVVADLKKERAGRTGEHLVSSLAYRIPSFGITPTTNHRDLIAQELLGYAIEMDGRPIVSGGKRITAADGRIGVIFDEFPEARALQRWTGKDFDGLEREMAGQWRDALKKLNLEEFKRDLKGVKERLGKTRDARAVLGELDKHLAAAEKYRLFVFGMDVLGVPPMVQRTAVVRWRSGGRLSLEKFAPYTYYALRLEMFFAWLIASDIISHERPSHRADFLYLFYLPFTEVFTSTDKLHGQIASLLLRQDQVFINGPELKADLERLNAYYKALPDEERAKGTATYARFPPLVGDFLISAVHDKLHPSWRKGASEPHSKMTPAENERLMQHLKPMMDALERATGQRPQEGKKT